MKFTGKNNEYFEIITINQSNCGLIKNMSSSELSLLWFQSDGNQLTVDYTDYNFNNDDMICLTEFHRVEIGRLVGAKLLKWNKHFYCIINHDSEVGCKGILFYGATNLPVIHLSEREARTFSTVWTMLEQEMTFRDDLQEEMLQMMLKRILILYTRIYKERAGWQKIKNENVDIIREYHFLVEKHFKEKHTVSEYADLLHKSPKTLSNLFRKLGSKSPLQFIKDRKMLEAKKLLTYTNKTISEIAYELGFADLQSFSRFFKKETGVPPLNFRK